MLLDDLADKLSSQGAGTVGTNLFKHQVPASPDELLAVIPTPGGPLERAMSASAGSALVERPHVQVLARAADPMTAHKKAQDAYGILDHLGPVTINGVLYHHVVALQPPFYLLEDDAQRHVWACNFEVVRDLATSS